MKDRHFKSLPMYGHTFSHTNSTFPQNCFLSLLQQANIAICCRRRRKIFICLKNFDAWLALAYSSFVVPPPMPVVDIAGESKVSGQNVCSFLACLKVFQMSQKLWVRTRILCSFGICAQKFCVCFCSGVVRESWKGIKD